MTRSVSRLLPLALVVLLAGCPRTPAAGGPKPAPKVTAPPVSVQAAGIARAAKALITTQARDYWHAWALGAQVRLAGTYQGHLALFSRHSIEVVAEAAKAETDPTRRLALRDLKDYLLGEHLASALAKVNQRIGDVEASALIHVGGDEVPYRDLGRLLASETDAGERERLYDAAGPVLLRLTPLVKRKAAITRKVTRALGYQGTLAFAAELRQVDLKRLARQARAVLDDTREVYRAALDRVATRRLGYGLAKVRRADLPRLFRTAHLDTAFPATRLVPRMDAALKAMGLSPNAGGHITVDAKARPRKSPNPVCFPISVPGDVRLSVRPVGGAADQAALMREMGRAQAYAHVKSKVFAFQQLGGDAVTRTWGILFASLVGNPAWLHRIRGLGGNAIAHLSEVMALQRLFLVRRFAARLLFEIAWQRQGGTGDPGALYGTWLSRAYQFPLDAEDRARWVVDRDPLLEGADALRAWFLEAEVEAWLTRKVGADWFADPRTGPLLEGLWADGSRLSPDDVAARVGATRVGPDALVEALDARLGPPPTAPAPATPDG